MTNRLSWAEREALEIVLANPGWIAREVVAALDYSKKGGLRVLRRLTEAGYLVQRPGKGHALRQYLTPAGFRAVLAQVEPGADPDRLTKLYATNYPNGRQFALLGDDQ